MGRPNVALAPAAAKWTAQPLSPTSGPPPLQIPLARGGVVTLSASRQLSESEWAKVEAFVSGSKDAFIEDSTVHVEDHDATGAADTED